MPIADAEDICDKADSRIITDKLVFDVEEGIVVFSESFKGEAKETIRQLVFTFAHIFYNCLFRLHH